MSDNKPHKTSNIQNIVTKIEEITKDEKGKKTSEIKEVVDTEKLDRYLKDLDKDIRGMQTYLSRYEKIGIDVTQHGVAGDGVTDDAEAIEAVINTAVSLGKSVYFPAGTYILGSTINISTSGITLFGVGRNSILKCKVGMNTFAIFAESTDNLVIMDLTIDGNKSNNTAGNHGCVVKTSDRFTIKNVYIHDTWGTGLTLQDSDDVLVEGCIFNDCGKVGGPAVANFGNGIKVNTGKRFRILGNKIAGSLSDGISLKDDTATGTSDFVISNNDISDVQTNQRSGIHIFRGNDGVISNNMIHDFDDAANGINGIFARGVSGANSISNYVISNNRIESVSGTGIELGSIGCAVTGNRIVISGTGSNGIGLFVGGGGTHAITGNEISNATQHGISVDSTGASIQGVVIVGNIVKNCQDAGDGSGVRVINATGNALTDVVISNNALYDDQGSPTQQHGVFFTGGGTYTNISCFGNLYSGNQDGDVSGLPSASAVLFDSPISLLEKSVDPVEPVEGKTVIWMSDGTGKGDDGDVMIAGKAGGATKVGTLFDHSGGAGW